MKKLGKSLTCVLPMDCLCFLLCIRFIFLNHEGTITVYLDDDGNIVKKSDSTIFNTFNAQLTKRFDVFHFLALLEALFFSF